MKCDICISYIKILVACTVPTKKKNNKLSRNNFCTR